MCLESLHYGKRDHKNLTVCGIYGAHDCRLLYCRTCKSRFSERKGTVLFNCKINSDKAISVLEHLSEGCGIRKTCRLTSVSLGSVSRLSKKAGKHVKSAHNELVAFPPHTNEVQFDEKWSFSGKKL